MRSSAARSKNEYGFTVPHSLRAVCLVLPIAAIVDGVQIVFYASEHPPPDFHAKFAEHQAVIDIESLVVTDGSLPVAKRRKVLAWAATRKAKPALAFIQATSHERVEKIS